VDNTTLFTGMAATKPEFSLSPYRIGTGDNYQNLAPKTLSESDNHVEYPSHNSTAMSSLRRFLSHSGYLSGCLALALPAFTAVADFTGLPSMGDSAGEVISPHEERKLGTAFLQQLRNANLILEDPETTAYLDSLGHQLAANSESPTTDFTFFLIDDNSINAFAGPGGTIGIHIGLILASENESELAGVMAHEVAHITQRHLARTFESTKKLSLASSAALLAAILIGTQNSEAGQAALAAVTAGSLQHRINFTRANEKEADNVGIHTLAQSGFDPFGMPRFFDRLQKNSRLYGSAPPEFLSTHPVNTNRIADATARAGKFLTGKIKNSTAFQLVRARLRVKAYDNPQQVLNDVGRYGGKVGLKTPVNWYEYALLLAANNQHQKTISIFKQLNQSDPDRIAYRLALANAYRETGQSGKALLIYEGSLSLYPGNLSILTPYARLLLADNQPQRAAHLLSDISNDKYNNSQIYKLRAQTASATDHPALAHESMAQYYYLNGYMAEAIEQLKLAKRERGLSNYESARIQARLDELESLKKEQKE